MVVIEIVFHLYVLRLHIFKMFLNSGVKTRYKHKSLHTSVFLLRIFGALCVNKLLYIDVYIDYNVFKTIVVNY